MKTQKYFKASKEQGLRNVKIVPDVQSGNLFWLKCIFPISIIIITFSCYHYSVNNEFTNWDDDRFVMHNFFIKSFSSDNLKMILFHSITGDYYNPVTMISYAINYHFSGLSPQSYYLTNIIIHILDSCLLYCLTLMLLNAMEKKAYGVFKWKQWLAFFCAMAFAVHPMHVESVSWVAERKDVLYTFFYFAGIIAYIKYLAISDERRIKKEELKTKTFSILGSYFLVFCLYVLSLLSKPMALIFPLSLVMIDMLLKRDKTTAARIIVIEKLPFIFLSIITAIITYHLQKSVGAIEEIPYHSLFHRFLFASYSFSMYIVKAFIPFHQSAFYPYPDIQNHSGYLPFIFYGLPLFVICLVVVPLYISYRYLDQNSSKTKQLWGNHFRIILFGMGFYFFNMVIISQIISSGPTLMADRYSYVCYFGIFFPAVCFVDKFIQKRSYLKVIIATIGSIYIALLGFLCYRQTRVWHNSQTLWSDVIKQYPGRIVSAYNNLGLYYIYNEYDYNKAYSNFHEAIRLGTNDPKVYCNLGLLMERKKAYDSARYYYTKAIKIDTSFSVAYMDRGIVNAENGRYNFALIDFRRSLLLKPYSESILENIAYTYLRAGEYDSSIIYYNHLIHINPSLYGYFQCRGLAEYFTNSLQPAMEDFKKTLEMAPHDSESMYYLSLSYRRMNDYDNEYKYARMAQNAQYPVPPEYIKELENQVGKK